jgi:hypothetical protein
MTRPLFSIAAALLLALSLHAWQSGAVAQESADTSTEAAADSASGDASAEASAETEAADPQSTTGEAEVQTDTQTSTSDESTSRDSSAALDASQRPATTDDSIPQPSDRQDVDVNADANADVDARRSDPRRDPRSYDSGRNDRRDWDTDRGRDIDRRDSDTDRGRDSDRRDWDDRRDADFRRDADRGRDSDWSRRHADRDDRDMRGRRHDRDHGIRFGRGSDRGLAVFEIDRNSFVFDSGLRRGDIIISLDGRPVRSEADFHRHWGHVHGDRVPLVILRDGRRETIYVEYPQDVVYRERVYDDRPANAPAYLGVVFDGNVRDAAVVNSVSRGSPAEEAGLQRGDMILAFNGEELRDYRDAIDIVRSMRPGDQLDIVFVRGRSEAETQAVLDARPVRTARYEERGIIAQPQPAEIEVEVEDRDYDRDNDRRLFNRDRDDDGQRDRGLLERVLD